LERGQELFNAPEDAMDEYDGMADYVNDCDALIAFIFHGGGNWCGRQYNDGY
jgi:hypothetical protein